MGVLIMLKLPDISEMLCISSVKDVSDFYAFKMEVIMIKSNI